MTTQCVLHSRRTSLSQNKLKARGKAIEFLKQLKYSKMLQGHSDIFPGPTDFDLMHKIYKLKKLWYWNLETWVNPGPTSS